jgi:hypothetical protein
MPPYGFIHFFFWILQDILNFTLLLFILIESINIFQQENCCIYGNQYTFKREVREFGWCVGLVQKYITMCRPQVKAETAKKLGLEFISITEGDINNIEIPDNLSNKQINRSTCPLMVSYISSFGYCRVPLISPCCSSFLLKLSTSFATTDTYSRLFLSPWIVNLRYSHIYGDQYTFTEEVEQFGWCVDLVQKYITMCRPQVKAETAKKLGLEFISITEGGINNIEITLLGGFVGSWLI